jgi:hypothetical protein
MTLIPIKTDMAKFSERPRFHFMRKITEKLLNMVFRIQSPEIKVNFKSLLIKAIARIVNIMNKTNPNIVL